MIQRPYATVTIGDDGKKDSDTFRTGDNKVTLLPTLSQWVQRGLPYLTIGRYCFIGLF